MFNYLGSTKSLLRTLYQKQLYFIEIYRINNKSIQTIRINEVRIYDCQTSSQTNVLICGVITSRFRSYNFDSQGLVIDRR